MQNKIVFFIIALVLFSLVVLDLYWWITISTAPMQSFQQAKDEYLSVFPKVIRDARLITLFNILFLCTAAFLFYQVKTAPGFKTISLALFFMSLLLMAWQLFSLM